MKKTAAIQQSFWISLAFCVCQQYNEIIGGKENAYEFLDDQKAK